MRPLLFQILILLFFFSCTNNRKNGGTDAVYAEYSITGEEGAENVTGVLKFFRSRSSAVALLLEPPAAVLFDSTALQPDSAGKIGAYYEVRKPATQFAGTHTIVFKNTDGKRYKESFNFEPFAIAGEVAGTVPRMDWALKLNGVKSGETIRVVLIDTSFASPDINEMDTVKNGVLLIGKSSLRNVLNGPVTLQLFKEEERPLQQPPSRGGKLSITYSVSRELILEDEGG